MLDIIPGIVTLLVFVIIIYAIYTLLRDILSQLRDAVDNLRARIKAVISVILALFGIWFTDYVAKKYLPDLSKIEETQELIISRQDSIGQVLSRGDSVTVENIQILQRDQQKALLKIDSLNACIDSHFVNTRARLIRMEKKLE